jgi:hypothetical protein
MHLFRTALICVGLFPAAWTISGTASAGIITFDNLPDLPALNGAASFSVANGGSNTLSGVTFPTTFAISGNQNTLPSGGQFPFLTPHSGHYAAYGFQNTAIQTNQVLESVYLGTTSFSKIGDGVTGLTIEALNNASSVLGFVTVTNLAQTEVFVDTRSFNSLSGITSYLFRPDSYGQLNPDGSAFNARFSADDFNFNPAPTTAAPQPSGFVLFVLGLACIPLIRRWQILAGGAESCN